MKKHDPIPMKKVLNRANLIMRRDLGWMRGFPTPGGKWVSIDEGGATRVIEIGRSDLRRATYSLNVLYRDFPRALPVIVKNVEAWTTLHRGLLKALKPVVHSDAGLPSSAGSPSRFRSATRKLAKNLSAEFPTLSPALDAFSWLHWLTPELFHKSLVWLKTNAHVAKAITSTKDEGDSSVLLAQLWTLELKHGKARGRGLLLWLVDADLFNVCTNPEDYLGQVESAIAKVSDTLPAPPRAKCGTEFLDWFAWLTEQPGKVAARSLELFEQLHGSLQTDAWRSWWAEVNALVHKSQRAPMKKEPKRSKKRKALRAQILSLNSAAPPVLPAKKFFSLLREESEQQNLAQFRAIKDALNVLPIFHEGKALRLAFLSHWNSNRRHYVENPKALTSLLTAFQSHLQSQDGLEQTLKPWEPVWRKFSAKRRYASYTLDTCLLVDLKKPAFLSIFFDALAQLQKKTGVEGVSDSKAQTLAELVPACGNAEGAVAAFITLEREGLLETYLPDHVLSFAARLCAEGMASFAKTVKLVIKHDDFDLEALGKSLMNLWGESPKAHLRQAIINGHLPVLYRSAMKAEVIRHLGGIVAKPSVKEDSKSVTWAKRYPKALNAALSQLAIFDPAAKSTASRILAKDFPDPAKIRDQIATLKKRLAAGDIIVGAQIAALEARLTSERTPGTGRLDNLRAKIERSTCRAQVNGWARRIDEEFVLRLPTLLRTEEVEDWVREPNILELISPIPTLSASVQKLARDLFQRRCGPPPWGLRERAENSAFIASMRVRKINMGPWLDAAPTLTRTHRDRVITFTLERDPLEVLRMGAHFKTCLSPGSFNYFSTFANAADVNKQVLYGRYPDGSVAARCLLALSDAGGILAFHPYSHDKSIGFEDVLAEYLSLLGTQMGTALLPRGKVSCLVAKRWYDDGTVDITDQFAFLKSDAFASKLSEAALENVVEILLSFVAPLRLDELVLPSLLTSRVFNERPELVQPLLPLILKNGRLRPELLLQVSRLLIHAGQLNDAALFSKALVRYAIASDQEPIVNDCLSVLAECAPSKALLLLQKWRRHLKIKVSEEDDGGRLYFGAVANLKLHRRAQAKRLLEAGVQAPCCSEHRNDCARLLEERF